MQVITFPNKAWTPKLFTRFDDFLCFWSYSPVSRHVSGDFTKPESWKYQVGIADDLGTYTLQTWTLGSVRSQYRGAANLAQETQVEQLKNKVYRWHATSSERDPWLARPEGTPPIYYASASASVVFRGNTQWFLHSPTITTIPVVWRGLRGGSHYTTFIDAEQQKISNDNFSAWFDSSYRGITQTSSNTVISYRGNLYYSRYDWVDVPAPSYRLELVSRSHVEPESLLSESREILDFAISPDGRLLAVGTRKDLCLYSLDGTGRISGCSTTFNFGAARCCFSSDGLTLTVLEPDQLDSYYVRAARIIDME